MTILNYIRDMFRKKSVKEQELGQPSKLSKIGTLTQREYEAFCILVEGYTLKYCAEKMGIKFSTANTYQNAIYKKLAVKNRANLIIEYKDIAKN